MPIDANLMKHSGSVEGAAPGGQDQWQTVAPTISLPKGGGAVRGMGEKFAANPVTGPGSMSVSIATSLRRSGFGSQLLLPTTPVPAMVHLASAGAFPYRRSRA
jgi:hypothetical protein